jgi:hypothetical protein
MMAHALQTLTAEARSKAWIKQAFETANPDLVSDTNSRQLAIFNVMPAQMSWFYCRRMTKPRQEIIAALQADLERLSHMEPLSEEQIEQRALDLLQAFTPEAAGYAAFREGRVTVAVDEFGFTDMDALEARFPQYRKRTAT